MSTEKVLVVPRERIAPYFTAHGLIQDNLDAAVATIESNFEFLPRPEAEEKPEFKQIIPYVVLKKDESFFAMRRLPKGGEARLHGMISLGVGGHINPDDTDGGDALMRGMRREIAEEVSIEQAGKLSFHGMINDDTTAVGSVHLGLFCVMEVSGEVSVLETEKLEGFWCKKNELAVMADKMETWSSLVIDALNML